MFKIILHIVAIVVISPAMTKLFRTATLLLSSAPNFFGKRIVQFVADIIFIVFCSIMLYSQWGIETVKKLVNKK